MHQSNVDTVRSLVEQLPKTNLRSGVDHRTGFQYTYLCPSPDEYRWQWFWDSCFHAVVMAHVNPQLAVAELRTLMAAQEPDGFVGHVSFWGSRFMGDLWGRVQSTYAWRQHHTALIQPPMVAQAVERVAEVLGDVSMPSEFMAPLDRYHQWLAEHRVPDDDGLLVIISPFESGTNQSPTFDEVLGLGHAPGRWRLGFRNRWLDLRNALANYDSGKLVKSSTFRVKDSLVNALYADSLATMARLHRHQGEGEMANAYSNLASVVVASLVGKLWDRSRGAFFSLYGPTERRTAPLTVGSLMPLVIRDLPQEVALALVERHLSNPAEFSLPYPVASVAASESSFDPRGRGPIWRGPSWVNTNWLLWRGLRRHGFHDEALQLADRTIAMVAQAGLREYFHPYNGQGLGARSFAWSGLALDMASTT
jgi:hypothetical protein